jgi:hypothetical protein
MPMKAMIYKTLSTVVDDFFAYETSTILSGSHHNPWISIGSASRCHFYTVLHVSGTIISLDRSKEILTFGHRDDVVFLIFLYQVSYGCPLTDQMYSAKPGELALDLPD